VWLGVAVLGLSAIVGAAIAVQISLGLALLAAVLYLVVTRRSLELGIALWIPLVFVDGVHALNLAGKAAALIISYCWLGTLRDRSSPSIVHDFPRLMMVLAVLLAWLTLSITWAADSGAVVADLWHWYVVAAVIIVVGTTMVTANAVRLAVGAFVVGGFLSIALGLAGLKADPVAGAIATGRFQGVAGDPNLLAAGLLPALLLAAGLLAGIRARAARLGIFVVMATLAAGIAASQSRGAIIAAAATVPLAVVMMRRRRLRVSALVGFALIVAALWMVQPPAARQRLTHYGSGDGREDLWRVAARIAEDHPVAGVGLNNFRSVEGDYVNRVGPLQYVDLIAVKPHEVHNIYLQLLAEEGVVGFVLFASFTVGALRAARVAARRFEALGDEPNAVLANAVLLAAISMLVAGFFLSILVDRRLWILLALGPTLLVAARNNDVKSAAEGC
jgi:O-antigen ligase